MALPVNIEDLVNGRTVEWERLEFKKGWNPEAVVHTMTAFANDINNWGGGYIIMGVDEVNGKPVLPPNGLNQNQMDTIQKKVIELCHKIHPQYRPKIEPYFFQDKHILILWCPAGDMRPYKAPKRLGQDENNKIPYIRSGSKSIIAKGDNLRQLEELTARIPYDDRINPAASLDDLNLGLIRVYLKEIKSKLFEESHQMDFAELCKQMHIVKGADEFLQPLNVGLMFFNDNPENFFPYAQIEMVIHKDDSGRNFTEKIFNGPLNKQLNDALAYIQTNIIIEEVRKHPDKAKADRFYNYPYDAVEEVLSNAVYHKGYDQADPIEVQILPDAIEVLSYPGPMPPIDNRMLQQRRVSTRRYRNRRIGEFLKELELTEGRATGFPLIRDAMEANGSPGPEFHTDEGRTFFQAVLKIHPWFRENQSDHRPKEHLIEVSANNWKVESLEDVNSLLDGVMNNISDNKRNEDSVLAGDQVESTDIEIDKKLSDQVGDQVGDKAKKILEYCSNIPRRKKDILTNVLSLSNHTKNYNKYIKPLIDSEWLDKTEKERSSKQAYETTVKGKLLLKILEDNNR